MSKKDPAFLFYSKNWLEGTAEFSPAEKGIYIDLLAHQHQKGSIPSDLKRLRRLTGASSEEEFLTIWETIKDKFELTDNNRMVNRTLTEIVTERLTRGRTNKIISALAVAVKKSKEPYELKYKAKMGFNVSDFTHLKDTEITEKVTEWFTERLTRALVNVDVIVDSNIITNNNYKVDNVLVSNMIKIFNKKNPNIKIEPEVHFPPCLQIAYRIAKMKGWEQKEVLNGKMQDTLISWEKIVDFVLADEWLSTRSLMDLNTSKEWDRLVLKMSKPKKDDKSVTEKNKEKEFMKSIGL